MNDPDADITKPDSSFKYLWNVPLTLYLFSENDQSNLFINEWLTYSEKTLEISEEFDLLVLNHNYANLVRVLYEGELLQTLLQYLGGIKIILYRNCNENEKTKG